jgi:hypothetical protein
MLLAPNFSALSADMTSSRVSKHFVLQGTTTKDQSSDLGILKSNSVGSVAKMLMEVLLLFSVTMYVGFLSRNWRFRIINRKRHKSYLKTAIINCR